MLTLPIDHPEPAAATLGTMLYPGTDDGDQARAGAFAAQNVSQALRHFADVNIELSYETLDRLFRDSGEPIDDKKERLRRGIVTGELFKTYFILANTSERLASWNNTIKVAESITGGGKVSGSRSFFWECRRQFLPVAHLWAAWCIRGREFTSHPDVGYDLVDDFQSFLTESEILREWGQVWKPKRAKSAPPLPNNVWRVPNYWRPPLRKPGWPPTGKVPHLALPDKILSELNPSGRPSKQT